MRADDWSTTRVEWTVMTRVWRLRLDWREVNRYGGYHSKA
jgi:hypothetical protein